MQMAPTELCDIHPDIIQSHLLPRLDGCTLATLSCSSSTLRSLSSSRLLWSRICNLTWPSTTTPLLHHLISSFPSNGPLSFFSLAFPLLPHTSFLHSPSSHLAPDTLLSAVDLFYKGLPILSKALQTDQIATDWFRSAPFRIDLLDLQEVAPTPIPSPSPDDDDPFQYLYRDLELSWIVIDPSRWRAVNVSSMKPVSVHHHWLTGEVQAKFATVMEGAGARGQAVLCVVEVTWAAINMEEEGPLRVREVGLKVEDVEGTRLCGKDSIEILHRALEYQGRRVVVTSNSHSNNCEIRRSKYEEFMERRRESKERRKREEDIWDMAFVSIALLLFAALFLRFFTDIIFPYSRYHYRDRHQLNKS